VREMNWWNVIKQTDMPMSDEGMEMDAEEGGIKPAKDMHEAREHPVDPAIAEEMEKTLYGGQKKLDKDGDGDIDGKDFKQLREAKK